MTFAYRFLVFATAIVLVSPFTDHRNWWFLIVAMGVLLFIDILEYGNAMS